MSGEGIKRWIVWLALAFGVMFAYPTIRWSQMSPDERRADEIAPDSLSKWWLKHILNLGLDLQGGIHLILEVDTAGVTDHRKAEEVVEQAKEIIRNRVDQLGLREPLIVRQGARWIVVQLPGMSETANARELIGKTARLEFHILDESGAAGKIGEKARDLGLRSGDIVKKEDDKIVVQKDLAALVPTGYTLLPGTEDSYMLVKSTPEMSGDMLENAEMMIGGQYSMPYVQFTLKKEGTKLFAQVTEINKGRRLAIVLDGVIQSAPNIKEKIPSGEGVIEGRFTPEEARKLAIVLRSGALPANVKIIEDRVVGPSLGRDSIRSGVTAGLIGAVIVMLFMILYYKTSGMVANVALVMNIFLLFAAMAYLQATLTLPGIAGVILTAGMAVDANVLIYERFREELRAGKTIRVAIDAGYEKAFSAIFDSNLTTLITALFLFQFGTGPIKGFAVTLTLGLAISMFTALVVTRIIFNYMLQKPGSTVSV